jgi:hypothetical protein
MLITRLEVEAGYALAVAGFSKTGTGAGYHKEPHTDGHLRRWRSKIKTAQINEALCKVLCHNICCLIQSMYELNLRAKFWKEVA